MFDMLHHYFSYKISNIYIAVLSITVFVVADNVTYAA